MILRYRPGPSHLRLLMQNRARCVAAGLAMAIKNDIAGWTAPTARSQDRSACLGNACMNTGQGPDLLGV